MRLPAMAVLAVLVAGPCLAADLAEPVSTVGRFQLAPAEGGFIRLDTETGETAFCQAEDDGWICEGLDGGSEPDDSAVAGRVDALAAEVAKLTAALSAIPGMSAETADRLAALDARIDAMATELDALGGRVAMLGENLSAPVATPAPVPVPPTPSVVAEAAAQPGDDSDDEGFMAEAVRRLMALASALRGAAPSV